MNRNPFTADQLRPMNPRATRPHRRWALASVVLTAAIAAACGGGAPTPTTEVSQPEPASGVVLESATTAQPAEAAATTLSVSARSPFVASIAADAVRQSNSAKRLTGASAPLPLEWLDATPPVGVPGAPVIVVVPGALPGRDNTMSLTPGLPTSSR